MSKRGFTLTEVLIAIAIISIIAAIAIPATMKAKRKSDETAAIALVTDMAIQLRTCKTITETYPADVYPGKEPVGCANISWPQASKSPLKGTLDYENWEMGDGARWIGLTYMVGDRIGGVRNPQYHNATKGTQILRGSDGQMTIVYGIAYYQP